MRRNVCDRQAGLRASTSGRTSGHWTLAESNPGRVTQVEYAKAVGVGRTTIQKYVAAYVEKMSDASDTPWSKIIDRKALGAEDEAEGCSTRGTPWSERIDRKALGAEAEATTDALGWTRRYVDTQIASAGLLIDLEENFPHDQLPAIRCR